MLLGCGRVGDYLGDPMSLLSKEMIAWLDIGKTSLRAFWTVAGYLPSTVTVITYKDGAVITRGAISPDDFTAVSPGVVPALAAVPVAPGVSDSVYDPLGGLKLINLQTIKLRFTHTTRGMFRMADNSLSRYELFRGVGAQPDLNGAAWQTFSTLPNTTPALTVGNTYYFVLRYRNFHNLSSQNVAAWSVILDGSGNSISYPSSPSEQTITPAAAGAGLITASYDYMADQNDGIQADKWLVWITGTGVAPNPAVDLPTYTEDMVLSEGRAVLRYTSGAFADGSTLKAIVRTRRSGAPNYDSTNTAIMQATADAVGPGQVSNINTFLGMAANQG